MNKKTCLNETCRRKIRDLELCLSLTFLPCFIRSTWRYSQKCYQGSLRNNNQSIKGNGWVECYGVGSLSQGGGRRERMAQTVSLQLRRDHAHGVHLRPQTFLRIHCHCNKRMELQPPQLWPGLAWSCLSLVVQLATLPLVAFLPTL